MVGQSLMGFGSITMVLWGAFVSEGTLDTITIGGTSFACQRKVFGV